MISCATGHMRDADDGQGTYPSRTSGNDICLGLLMRMTEIECAAAPVMKSHHTQSSRDQEKGLDK